MIEYLDIKDKFSDYKEKILEITKNKMYAYDRYDIEFSSLMIYSSDPIDLDICSSHIRQSDNIFSLEKNLYVVIYDVVKPEDAIKAAQNILHAYHHHNVKQELYLVVANAQQGSSANDMVNCLFAMLEYAVKESSYNTVIDMQQINCH